MLALLFGNNNHGPFFVPFNTEPINTSRLWFVDGLITSEIYLYNNSNERKESWSFDRMKRYLRNGRGVICDKFLPDTFSPCPFSFLRYTRRVMKRPARVRSSLNSRNRIFLGCLCLAAFNFLRFSAFPIQRTSKEQYPSFGLLFFHPRNRLRKRDGEKRKEGSVLETRTRTSLRSGANERGRCLRSPLSHELSCPLRTKGYTMKPLESHRAIKNDEDIFAPLAKYPRARISYFGQLWSHGLLISTFTSERHQHTCALWSVTGRVFRLLN